MKVLAWLGEDSLPGCRLLFVYLRGGKGRAAVSGLGYKGINLIHENFAFSPTHLPKVPPPNTIRLDIRISTYVFGGEKYLDHSTGLESYRIFDKANFWAPHSKDYRWSPLGSEYLYFFKASQTILMYSQSKDSC